MLKNNIENMHSAKLIFDTLDEVRNYEYFSNLDTGDCIIVLGNVSLGDGICQVRRIEAQDDTTHTGILLKDKRYATIMYDIKLSNEGGTRNKSVTISNFFSNKETNKIPLTGISEQDIENAKEIVLYSKCESGKSIGICPMISIPVVSELKTGGVTGYLIGSADGNTTKMIGVVFKIDGNSLSYKILTNDVSCIKDTIGNLTVVKNITVVLK